jgi:MSHA pilin protein MshD
MCAEAKLQVPSPASGGGSGWGRAKLDRAMRPHPFPLSRARERGNGQRRFALARGATLVEVVLFIVIIATALTAVLGTLNLTVGRSADPLVARQALSIAESLLQEVMSQPYTASDLDGGSNAIGPETGETRSSTTTPFDHVDDFNGYSMTGIVKPDGTPVTGLGSYNASVTVQAQALDNIPAAEGLLVTVTVSGPGGYSVALRGFRARVAP